MEIQEAFGMRLKELRTNAMLSQVELAKRSGIERAQISKIENGTATSRCGTRHPRHCAGTPATWRHTHCLRPHFGHPVRSQSI